jgi:hypothetical protein
MSSMTVIQLYESLSIKLGKETAENLNSYMENKIKEEIADNLKILATKQDVADLRTELKQDIADLRTDFANLRAEMKSEKADLIKWSFLFWLGQIITLLLLLKK